MTQDPDRVQVIKDFKTLLTFKQLLSFLGMFNYLRIFTSNMSELVESSKSLLKKRLYRGIE